MEKEKINNINDQLQIINPFELFKVMCDKNQNKEDKD